VRQRREIPAVVPAVSVTDYMNDCGILDEWAFREAQYRNGERCLHCGKIRNDVPVGRPMLCYRCRGFMPKILQETLRAKTEWERARELERARTEEARQRALADNPAAIVIRFRVQRKSLRLVCPRCGTVTGNQLYGQINVGSPYCPRCEQDRKEEQARAQRLAAIRVRSYWTPERRAMVPSDPLGTMGLACLASGASMRDITFTLHNEVCDEAERVFGMEERREDRDDTGLTFVQVERLRNEVRRQQRGAVWRRVEAIYERTGVWTMRWNKHRIETREYDPPGEVIGERELVEAGPEVGRRGR
jgi:hypothetical protein